MSYENPLDKNVSHLKIFNFSCCGCDATQKSWFCDCTLSYLKLNKSVFSKHYWVIFLQIFGEANIPSTSFSPASTSQRNSLKQSLSAEASNPGHAQGSKIGPSSSLMSSLQHMSSAKWLQNMVFCYLVFHNAVLLCNSCPWPFVFCCISSYEALKKILCIVSQSVWSRIFKSFIHGDCKCARKLTDCIAPILRPFSVASFLRWLQMLVRYKTDFPGLAPVLYIDVKFGTQQYFVFMFSCNINVCSSPVTPICYLMMIIIVPYNKWWQSVLKLLNYLSIL